MALLSYETSHQAAAVDCYECRQCDELSGMRVEARERRRGGKEAFERLLSQLDKRTLSTVTETSQLETVVCVLTLDLCTLSSAHILPTSDQMQ